jgi:cathepsin L
MFGNYGCDGGWMGQVFDYVKLNGITTEEKYPTRNDTFFLGETGDCEQRKGEFRIRGYSYTSYKLYDCDSLTNMIQKRPVTVAVSVNWPFIFYHKGIFDSCDPISDIDINHALLLVGVVENSAFNYWIVKNSWGVTWGELGYMRLDRYKDYGNQC